MCYKFLVLNENKINSKEQCYKEIYIFKDFQDEDFFIAIFFRKGDLQLKII